MCTDVIRLGSEKMAKKNRWLLGILLCGLLAGCGQKETAPEPETTGQNVTEEAQTETEDLKQEENAEVRELTADEVAYFSEYIKKSENYGFLLSVYDSADEVNLDELFYSGAGIDAGSMTDTDIAAFLKASGQEEIYTDVAHLTTDQLDEFLLKKTGYEYSQMKCPLSWVYSAETDTYYQEAGDTNYTRFDCIGGMAAGDLYTLHVQKTGDGTGYRMEEYELVLRKQGADYQVVSNHLLEKEGLISEQTFEIENEVFGKVTFASYLPAENTELKYADVTFKIIRNGEVLSVLVGMTPDNLRENLQFRSVDAVSFKDYNSDGHKDILIIASYEVISGEKAKSIETEVRIYSGNEYGYYPLEEKLTEDTNSALTEKTIDSILGFLGAGEKDTEEFSEESWKKAYIAFLKKADAEGQWQGYTLIYLDDDDIPELVEVGNSEAVGCKIVNYADGVLKESQLNRLYFSYIEKENLLCNSEGNMDSYYDLVYKLADGVLTPVAAGYYGAEDNSNVQYDENGEPVYQYEWNGKNVSKAEYTQSLNAVYDTSKARVGYLWDELDSADELIEKLR